MAVGDADAGRVPDRGVHPPVNLDRRALGLGGATYLGIAVPCGLVIALLHGNDTKGHESSLWILAALLVFIAGPVAAGTVAGRAQPRAPLTHGALSVAVPATAFFLVWTMVRAAQGTLSAARVLTFVLYLGVVTGFSLLGGYIGFRRSARAT